MRSSVCVSTDGQRVIEHQDARVANDGARNGRALLLPAGKRDAALAHQRAITLGKALDVVGDVGRLGSAADVFVGGILRSEGDVVANAVAEQERLLRNEADVGAQNLQRILANRPAIDQNRALASRRRFAGSARPASICPSPSGRRWPGWFPQAR